MEKKLTCMPSQLIFFISLCYPSKFSLSKYKYTKCSFWLYVISSSWCKVFQLMPHLFVVISHHLCRSSSLSNLADHLWLPTFYQERGITKKELLSKCFETISQHYCNEMNGKVRCYALKSSSIQETGGSSSGTLSLGC